MGEEEGDYSLFWGEEEGDYSLFWGEEEGDYSLFWGEEEKDNSLFWGKDEGDNSHSSKSQKKTLTLNKSEVLTSNSSILILQNVYPISRKI